MQIGSIKYNYQVVVLHHSHEGARNFLHSHEECRASPSPFVSIHRKTVEAGFNYTD